MRLFSESFTIFATTDCSDQVLGHNFTDTIYNCMRACIRPEPCLERGSSLRSSKKHAYGITPSLMSIFCNFVCNSGQLKATKIQFRCQRQGFDDQSWLILNLLPRACLFLAVTCASERASSLHYHHRNRSLPLHRWTSTPI